MKNSGFNVNDKLVVRKKTNKGQITKSNGSKINLIEYEESNSNTKSYKIIESSDNDFFDNTIKFTVPKDRFFFFGDNRDNSKDSRAPEVGFVPKINFWYPENVCWHQIFLLVFNNRFLVSNNHMMVSNNRFLVSRN